jgi:large subunit ribosomal protein L13
MNTNTYQPKAKDVKREWHLIDAKDQVLGRLATDIVKKLMGKQKPTYAPHMDNGDVVVVINAKDITVTGDKENSKVYHKHSGYPGGYHQIKYSKWLTENPSKIIEHAVAGMLPVNRLKKKRMARLKVYANSDHRHKSQFSVKSAE